MRNLVWSKTDIEEGQIDKILPVPRPSTEDWRDYKDIAVLAFPTPKDDTGELLVPRSVKSDTILPWEKILSGEKYKKAFNLTSSKKDPHWVEVNFSDPVVLRTIEFSNVRRFNHKWCYVPGVYVKAFAILPNRIPRLILNTPMPQAEWQSDSPITLACDKTDGVETYPYRDS